MGVLDLDKIKRAHQRFLAEHNRQVDVALSPEMLTPWVWRYVSQHGGFTSRTGNLVHKSKVALVRMGKNRRIRVSNSAKYAAAQDGGSGLYGPKRRKYLIRPKNGKALRFVKNGRFIFARSVMHPGVHPTRFLYNANDALFRATKQWLRMAMRRAADKF
jgi:hypothetical protein